MSRGGAGLLFWIYRGIKLNILGLGRDMAVLVEMSDFLNLSGNKGHFGPTAKTSYGGTYCAMDGERNEK